MTYTEQSFGSYLRDKLEAYYNLFNEAPMACDFMAVYNQRNAAYAVLKKIEYYAFENNEAILFTASHDLSEVDFDVLSAQIDATHNEIVSRSKDHMSSSIYLVYTVNAELDQDTLLKIKRFKYYKSFRWGLEGWLNVGLVVINELTGEAYSNRFGNKEMKRLNKLYQQFKAND